MEVFVSVFPVMVGAGQKVMARARWDNGDVSQELMKKIKKCSGRFMLGWLAEAWCFSW